MFVAASSAGGGRGVAMTLVQMLGFQNLDAAQYAEAVALDAELVRIERAYLDLKDETAAFRQSYPSGQDLPPKAATFMRSLEARGTALEARMKEYEVRRTALIAAVGAKRNMSPEP